MPSSAKPDTSSFKNVLPAYSREAMEVYDLIPIGIFYTDEDGTCIYANPLWHDVFGFDPALDLQNDWLETVHELDHEEILLYWRAAIDEHCDLDQRFRINHSSKGVRWVRLRLTHHLIDEHSQFVGTVEDITAQIQMEKQNGMIVTALESAADAILICDAEGNVEYINHAFSMQSGFSRADTLGRNICSLRNNDDADTYATQLKNTVETGKVWRGQLSFHRKDGTEYAVNVTLAPVLNSFDNSMKCVAVEHDITKQIEREQELMSAKNEAERASQAKSDFLSRMSHELRTPMNSVLGFAQLLESDPDNPLSSEQLDLTGRILSSGQHLLDLINDVLDLARIDAGKVSMSPESVEASSLVNECVSIIEPLAIQRSITIVNGFDSGEETYATADRVRLKQTLLNLMSNAVKYNRDQGRITIARTLTERNELRIDVTDTGKGMTPEQISVLFDPFNRLGAEDTAIEGTGIGLTITKNLVELMGGRMDVSSSVGEGSTFSITLPLSSRPSETLSDSIETLTPQARTSNQVRTILYVDDNPVNIELVQMILERRDNIEFISASQATLGIEIAKTRQPDLILLDINMPGMDGFEAFKHLQELEQTKDIPVIALSANAMPRDIERGKKLGFVDYLTKPLDIPTFLNAIDACQ